jgi:hypothetical protein
MLKLGRPLGWNEDFRGKFDMQDDFMEDPPKKFFRLGPGREVRLRYAYFIRCEQVVKDQDGNAVELHCTYDPATRGQDLLGAVRDADLLAERAGKAKLPALHRALGAVALAHY